jgi:hypothetical protein
VSGRQSLPFLPLADLDDSLFAAFDLFARAGVRSMTGAGVVLQASTNDVSKAMQL